jgi:hypothetical protein
VRTNEECTEFLRRKAFFKAGTQKVIETVLTEEDRKPESIFDFGAGITAVARDKPHQARLDFEVRAKKLLDRPPEIHNAGDAECRVSGFVSPELRSACVANEKGRTDLALQVANTDLAPTAARRAWPRFAETATLRCS